MIPWGNAGMHGWLQSEPQPVMPESVPGGAASFPPLLPSRPLSRLCEEPPSPASGTPPSAAVVPLPPHEQPWLIAPVITPIPRAAPAAETPNARLDPRAWREPGSNGVDAALAAVRDMR